MAEDDIAFMNLILLMGTMASQRLEAAQTGEADRRNEYLHRCRETLDMLVSLRKRTAGRLSAEEEKVLETILRDLQVRYVQVLARSGGTGAPKQGPAGASA